MFLPPVLILDSQILSCLSFPSSLMYKYSNILFLYNKFVTNLFIPSSTKMCKIFINVQIRRLVNPSTKTVQIFHSPCVGVTNDEAGRGSVAGKSSWTRCKLDLCGKPANSIWWAESSPTRLQLTRARTRRVRTLPEFCQNYNIFVGIQCQSGLYDLWRKPSSLIPESS